MRPHDVTMGAVRDGVRTVAEGDTTLSGRLDAVSVDAAAVGPRMERIEVGVAPVASGADHLEQGLAVLRVEAQESFAERRAIIELSQAEVEDRATKVEGALAGVLDRVERLGKCTPW
jgi:hypothetical protein